MKRLAYSFFAVALTLGFNACEGHSDEQLPEHYRERMENPPVTPEAGKLGETAEKAPAGEHAKPAEGEPKAH